MIARQLNAILLAAVLLLSWVNSAWAQQASWSGKSDVEIRQFAAAALNLDSQNIRIEPLKGIARPVTRGGETLGYLGSTWDIAHTAGYSGLPVDIMVLVDSHALIRGALLVQQQEPVLNLGIAPESITAFINGFAGYDLAEPLQPAGGGKPENPDAIAGATISSGVIRSGIIRTARTIANAHGLLPSAAGAKIDTAMSAPMSWDELLASQAITRLSVSNSEADTALGIPGAADPASRFIDLYTAVLDPPRIGASLIGESGYSSLMGSIGSTDHLLLIAANGLYSFKGTDWRKTGVFERIEISQGAKTISFAKDMHHSIERLEAQKSPEFREIGVFAVPSAAGFDPTRSFTLSLLALRDGSDGAAGTARFSLDYALPKDFLAVDLLPLAGEDKPLWEMNWQKRKLAIGMVSVMLLSLYLILIFQNQIAARLRLYHAIRIGYLLATVVVLGGLIGAQLSVVHVLTFLQALRSKFSWEVFLLDPVIFIIWAWVAVALLFWGRVYCGWLCPFGASQELMNKLGQRLGVRQLTIPFALHERLWPIKYIIFLGLFAASLASMTLAFRGAEAEPFKTVITLHFVREWPFVAYAVGLLVVNVFVERFFCRYLCPLGAALAIPARLRMFEWLKRRPQCGRECRICAAKCPVQAIHPEGQINPNECINCLNCQTLYFNERICPPLKARAARYNPTRGTEVRSP
ncbi:MAG: NosR/NirI family protein [Hyphomicrobiales bacterium]|nr:NosR/NirI family protein [Hyphomicrobiales bacterium]